jgi:LacI family transcriptional regulator
MLLTALSVILVQRILGYFMTHVTLDDVARMAGVSAKTVSRVINNESNVATETSERVQRAVDKLKYVPNSAASSLSRGRAMAIGLVVGWSLDTAFSSMLLDNILRNVTRRGYSLVLFASDEHTAYRVATAFRGRQMDGIIMDSGAGANAEVASRVNALNRPCVVIHPTRLEGNEKSSFVRIDNADGARRATEHLIGLGHHTIGLVSFPHLAGEATERLSGYRAALEDAGIPFRADLIAECWGDPMQIGYKGAMQLIPTRPEITAVFGATDEIAIGALGAIWQMGLRVPEDISVIGFDDIAMASAINPPLTTIHQPIDEISRTAVDLVVDMIEGRSSGTTDLVLPTELVIRKSCLPPKRQQS